ncbi:MAG: FG-GAP repeat protein [Planctomycetes bacterium]|nr:FG-GAP repeat protein [Planctomycetota bacterium]
MMLLLAFQSAGAQAAPLIHDLFGVSVDRAGDLDGDGCEDIWVGDPSMPTWTDDSKGMAWAVSSKTGRSLLGIDSPQGAREFGSVVCGIGDVDGDGKRDVAVVAPRIALSSSQNEALPRSEASRRDAQGAVFVHSSASGKLLWVRRGAADKTKVPWFTFGHGPSLACVGDWNSDGVDDVAIGWSLASGDKPHSGSVEVVSGKDGSLLHSWPGKEANDRLGFALVALSDLDGDGKRDLGASAIPDFADAPADNNLGQIRPGYVLILSSKGGELRTLRGLDGCRRFGLSIAEIGDQNQDGVVDLVVGQPFFSDQPPRLSLVSGKDGSMLRVLSPPSIEEWDRGKSQSMLHPPPPSVRESFGARVLAVRDFDGDGCIDVLVTMPDTFCLQPAAILSSRSGGVLVRIAPQDPKLEFSHIGIGACCLSDLDGDAVPDFALSGSSMRSGDCDGAVVLCSGKTGDTLQVIGRTNLRR